MRSSKLQDTSCILRAGDHPFIRHDSFVAFGKAVAMPAPDILRKHPAAALRAARLALSPQRIAPSPIIPKKNFRAACAAILFFCLPALSLLYIERLSFAWLKPLRKGIFLRAALLAPKSAPAGFPARYAFFCARCALRRAFPATRPLGGSSGLALAGFASPGRLPLAP